MEKAAERILKAIKDKEQIIIYGDYDVDGITSVTVLKSFLEERGIQVNVYIPNRLNEGYGLNKTAMEEIAKQGNKLMITVDCGITAVDEVEYAKTFGIETIITDHHEPAEELPKAIAVVDAKRKDNKYECRNLAGVGVVLTDTKIRLDKEVFQYNQYAFKFQDEIKISTVVGIEWTLSKNSAYIPVVCIEPLELEGTTVKRVTGYNAKYIKDSGIKTGSIVAVCKANQIIPKIVEVIE